MLLPACACDPRAQEIGAMFFSEGLSLLEIAKYLHLTERQVVSCLVALLQNS